MYSRHLEEFRLFLEKKLGLSYPKKREGELEKKLIAITKSFKFDNPSNFVDWLLKGPLEKNHLAILADHLTIGETYFFRDERFYAALEKYILPEIINRHRFDRRIKIWSAACSSGEEPYSIAILLHQLLRDLENWDVTILGTDINPRFLDKAERGSYKKWSFRILPEKIKEKYFRKNQDDSFTLIPEIKKMVKFKQLNLVTDSYPEHEFDLISCHNVLIYFSEKQIENTINQFSQALNLEGILSLAPVETPFVKAKNLVALRYDRMVCHKIGVENSPRSKTIEKPRRKKEQSNVSIIEELPKRKIIEVCQELYKNKQYQETATQLEQYLIESKAPLAHLKEMQLLIRTYANQGDLSQALKWCHTALEADKLHPITHYLHASVLEAQGSTQEAIKSLKSAIFIDPNFTMAHFLLGLIEKAQGNNLAALHQMKIALKLIDDHPADIDIPGLDDIPNEHLKSLIEGHL